MASNNQQQNNPPGSPTALTIAITSGKGGVGKTNVTTNLGIALAKTGKRVCIFDADTSLANINILLNLHPERTLEHFLRDDLSIDDIMLSGPENLKIIPAATGIADFILLNQEQQHKLICALEELEQRFDYILIDTAAGISDSVLQFIRSAQYAVIVISPEPTSLTDAFSLIKVLKRNGYKQPIYVLVNMTKNYNHSMEVYRRFAHAVNKYVHIKVRYLGYIPTDKAVQEAILSQTPVVLSAPESPAGRCINLLASILLKHFTYNKAAIKKISDFWRDQRQSGYLMEGLSEGLAKGLEERPTETVNGDSTLDLKTEQPSTTTVPQQTDELDEPMTQQQAETQLADLIQYYLGEFGALPGQAIDLILQAFTQEQLSDENIALLKQHIFGDDNPSVGTKAAPASIQQIESHIDALAAQAEQTKAELTDLANHLQQKYRELYNQEILVSRPRLRAITEPPRSTTHSGQQEERKEREALLQSAFYASAVDRKPEN